MLESLIYIVTGLFVLAIPLYYVLKSKKASQRAAEIRGKAIERGLDEPVSLHPIVDHDICIGSGSCIQSCPEKDILGLIESKAELINPARCVGHGMCEAACPVGAITLVFGTERRGVDIPHVKGTYETNVPGVYIAGELGGMGLIRNAVNQGVQAAQFISQDLKQRSSGGVLDLMVVGAGPAGFAASLQARKDGLEFVTVDQEDMGGAIITYPRRKLVMTHPMELPIYGKVNFRNVEKEALVNLFQEAAAKAQLAVNANEKVDAVERSDDFFTISTPKNKYRARSVLLAIGRRGSPRKIGCPGEKSAKVSYRLLEPEKFHDLKILVVGGGDSAVEAALALAEQPGNTVHLSYRGENIFRIKDLNRERLERFVEKGKLTTLYNSTVTQIHDKAVELTQGDKTVELANDYVFVFIGGELPTEFLKRVGIEFTRKFGQR